MVTTADLYSALDGHHATVLGRRWQIAVYGIHEGGGRRWVQLAVEERPGQHLTVSLAPTDGIRHVLLTLGAWLARASESAGVRNVA
jgi:hypothetical protein